MKTPARCRNSVPMRPRKSKARSARERAAALIFKGKPTPGKSAVSPSEVVASYRRQAEQELNSERVPEATQRDDQKLFSIVGGTRK